MLSRWSVLVVLLAAVACDKVPLSAPSTATIVITSSARNVDLNGSLEITAVVNEATGTPVQNGTTVRFTTTLGSLDPVEALTRNGIATTTLRAGSVSGVAQVRAASGAASASAATNQIEVSIGAATAATISLSSSANTVPANGGTVTLTATVIDAAGNRVPGVQVTFSTTSGTLSNPTPLTDASGEATTGFTTSRTSTVTARVGAGDAARTATVTVTPAVLNSIALAVAPASVVLGAPVTLTVTPTVGANNTPSRIVVNWGDGSGEDLGVVSAARNVAHTYGSPGTFTITATATGDGEASSASTAVVVNPRQPLAVSLTATPSATTSAAGNTTTFTATVTPATGGADTVESYTWDFGDGTSATTSGNATSHVYERTLTPTRRTATVTVRTVDGRTAEGRAEFITPGG